MFSAPFALAELPPEPQFPNYTLPQANLYIPQYIGIQSSNFSLILAPTSPQNNGVALTAIPQTGCGISAQQSSNVGTILNQTVWSRGVDGWRNQWLIGGLTPSTNYTAYVVQDGTKVSGPIYFATKSGLCYLLPKGNACLIKSISCFSLYTCPFVTILSLSGLLGSARSITLTERTDGV